jgi:hypothetical protein
MRRRRSGGRRRRGGSDYRPSGTGPSSSRAARDRYLGVFHHSLRFNSQPVKIAVDYDIHIYQMK